MRFFAAASFIFRINQSRCFALCFLLAHLAVSISSAVLGGSNGWAIIMTTTNTHIPATTGRIIDKQPFPW